MTTTSKIGDEIVRVLGSNPNGITAATIASIIGVDVGKVRPRISIMKRAGIIKEVGKAPTPSHGRAPSLLSLV